MVVSSLRPISTYSADEIKRLSDLARWGRSLRGGKPRNLLIVLTATELFSEHIENAWKEAGGRAAELVRHPSVDLSNLDQLADATQRLYLNLPSIYDYGAMLKEERERIVNLIKARFKL